MEPTPFDRSFFANARITRMGEGSIGGKAAGLLDSLETLEGLRQGFEAEGVSIELPQSAVIATSHFDDFMERNDLKTPAMCGMPDERIAHLFQRAELPPPLVSDLGTIAAQVKSPMAVRSSSMLEDDLAHPFAGVYSTVMIPNNQTDLAGRLKRLSEAIKLVYASTFFAPSRRYLKSIGRDLGDEKMAILLQEVVGRRRDSRFYPHISAVARSHNHYTFGHAAREDGVVELALGLGKTIVDGDGGWSYCPAYPRSPAPFKGVGDMMKQTQKSFWAIDMNPTTRYSVSREDTHLVSCTLTQAEYDGTLEGVASTYDPRSDAIVPGIGRDGPRILTFAPLLQMGDSPVNDCVRALMTSCERDRGGPVEIELALEVDPPGPPTIHLLQTRSMRSPGRTVTIPAEDLNRPGLLVSSDRVLGDGERRDMRDIVYIKPESFEPRLSVRAAAELERVDGILSAEGKRYLLIGFGRFGTTDFWRGVPVEWAQISSARAIVEVYREGMETEFSQGSHFFHNMTSFSVSYFSVVPRRGYHVDWEWLEALPAEWEGELVRHVRAPAGMRIAVDGAAGRGVIER